MVRRALRIALWAGLLGGLTAGALRAARWFRDVGTPPPPAVWPPFPDLARPSHGSEPSSSGTAVPDAALSDEEMSPDTGAAEPVDGSCPESHPVKGKAASGLYHLPGMVAYSRTNADTCFVDAAAAEAAGFTRAKR
ncbi:MAG TPA: hypothetical protein VGH94_12270 [Acidimicrobiales bacterium]